METRSTGSVSADELEGSALSDSFFDALKPESPILLSPTGSDSPFDNSNALLFRYQVAIPPGCQSVFPHFHSVDNIPQQLVAIFTRATSGMVGGSVENHIQHHFMKVLDELPNRDLHKLKRDGTIILVGKSLIDIHCPYSLKNVHITGGPYYEDTRRHKRFLQLKNSRKNRMHSNNSATPSAVESFSGRMKTRLDDSVDDSASDSSKRARLDAQNGFIEPDYACFVRTLPLSSTNLSAIPSFMPASSESSPRQNREKQMSSIPPTSSTRPEGPGEVQALVSLVGEAKKNLLMARYGLAQGCEYLLTSHELCGTWLAFHHCATRFGRFVLLSEDRIALETVVTALQGKDISAATMFAPRSQYPLATLANDFLDKSSSEENPEADMEAWRRMWNTASLAFRLMQNYSINRPLVRLQPPMGSTWQRLRSRQTNSSLNNELRDLSTDAIIVSDVHNTDILVRTARSWHGSQRDTSAIRIVRGGDSDVHDEFPHAAEFHMDDKSDGRPPNDGGGHSGDTFSRELQSSGPVASRLRSRDHPEDDDRDTPSNQRQARQNRGRGGRARRGTRGRTGGSTSGQSANNSSSTQNIAPLTHHNLAKLQSEYTSKQTIESESSESETDSEDEGDMYGTDDSSLVRCKQENAKTALRSMRTSEIWFTFISPQTMDDLLKEAEPAPSGKRASVS